MLTNFKKLPVGFKRLLIAGTLFVPPILGVIFGIGYEIGESLILGYLFVSPIYWITILIGCWVYDGFKK